MAEFILEANFLKAWTYTGDEFFVWQEIRLSINSWDEFRRILEDIYPKRLGVNDKQIAAFIALLINS